MGVPVGMADLEEECDDYDLSGDAGPLPTPAPAPPMAVAQRPPLIAPKPSVGPPPTPPSAGSKPTLQLEPPSLDVVTEDAAAEAMPPASYIGSHTVVDSNEYGGDAVDGASTRGDHTPLQRNSSLMGFVSADEDEESVDNDYDYGLPAGAAAGGGEADVVTDTSVPAAAAAAAAPRALSGDPIPGGKYRATFTCVGSDEDELSFEKGAIIINVEGVEDEEGWWEGTHSLNGERGLFPTNYVQFYE